MDTIEIKNSLSEWKYNFNARETCDECVDVIHLWFERNAHPDSPAVIGMSGGKDSTIAAALCARALGKDRVVGVMLPDSGQDDNGAAEICEWLGIRSFTISIGDTVRRIGDDVFHSLQEITTQTEQNIPPRVRMATLYAVAQTLDGRVICTCNASEDYIGYSTLFGDSAGSYAPLAYLTVTEIYQIGDVLGIPEKWGRKTPDDGLPHSCPDEEKFGFSYETLDRFIRTGECDDKDIREKIIRMNRNTAFKRNIIQVPSFIPSFLPSVVVY